MSNKNFGLEVASVLMTGEALFYLYQVGYGTCEESQYWSFQHRERLTEEQLTEMVRESMFAVLDKVAGNFKDSGLQDSLHVGKKGATHQEVMGHPHFREAMQAHGFKEVKYMESFNLFGWSSCIDPDDWGADAGSNTTEMAIWLRDKCKEEGIVVEPFLYEKDVEWEERHRKEMVERGDSEKEIEVTLKKLRTYYRLARKESDE